MQRRVHEEAILQAAAAHGLQPCLLGVAEHLVEQAGFANALRLLNLGWAQSSVL